MFSGQVRVSPSGTCIVAQAGPREVPRGTVAAAYATSVASWEPEFRSGEPFIRRRVHSCGCSQMFRPRALVPYEHMFSSLRTSPLAQRALGALDLARSFLMLEDDCDVDWEVDRNELSAPIHPHRVPLRRGSHHRRPGTPAAAEQVCTTPIFNGQPTRQGIAGAPRGIPVPARRGTYPGGHNGQAARTETRAAGLSSSGCDRHAPHC